MFWFIMMGFVILVGFAAVIYLMPSESSVKGKKKKHKDSKLVMTPDPVAVDTTKDWKSIAERWEKHNLSLQGEIEKMKMDQKRAQQLTDEKKAETKDLIEKLALEKSWREKEQQTLERSKQHEKDLKDQIFRTESDLEKEHSNRLRLERELQEIRIKFDEVNEQKRLLSVKAGSQEATLQANIKDIRELRRVNAALKERREDIQWVAKAEFDELKQALAAKEKEIASLKKPNE